jgi:large subunit ribosomal protein L21
MQIYLRRAFDQVSAAMYNLRFHRSIMESDMYAAIKTGGKQYRVEAGEKIRIEQILADIGSELVIDQVLMVADGDNVSMGQPLVDGATVKATVLGQGRHDKVRIFKMRRRKHYQKHQGHRQNYTEIQITAFLHKGKTYNGT